MEFALSISMEEGVTRNDIALALQRTAARIKRSNQKEFEEGDSGPIRDLEGRQVGEWEIRKE